MLCLSLMLEPTYLPYFLWHEKGKTCIHLGLSLIEIIKKYILYDGDKNKTKRLSILLRSS